MSEVKADDRSRSGDYFHRFFSRGSGAFTRGLKEQA